MVSRSMSPSPYRGIIPPMITPLQDRDQLDVDGLERLIEHILGGGVHALFILGTTGEGPSLSYRLRNELIKRTCRQVNDRVPILVGITDTSFVESVNIARCAADAGAAALVAAPPYYFPAGQPELLEYTQHLVAALPLPLLLYNMPSHTKLCFTTDTVMKLAEIDRIVGLKDSSADLLYFRRLQFLLADRDDFALLIGPEELLAESVLLGGHGGVAGGANLVPRLYIQLYEAASARDLPATLALHNEVMMISSMLYSVGRHVSSVLKGVKCALACCGICSDFMAEPFHAFCEPEKKQVRQRLGDLIERWGQDNYRFSETLRLA